MMIGFGEFYWSRNKLMAVGDPGLFLNSNDDKAWPGVKHLC